LEPTLQAMQVPQLDGQKKQLAIMELEQPLMLNLI
jgi:hypothetical protein